MERFIKSIDKQIEFNHGKNIFFNNPKIFEFINETINAISNIHELNIESEKLLIEYSTDKAIEEFCRINQYYSFNTLSKEELRIIYADLFLNIRSGKYTTDELSGIHYQNLKVWLKKHNPFAEKMYTSDTLNIESVACSEYSPELQLDILQINLEQIVPPVLDIGCGKQANLVHYFNRMGIEAHGIDRFTFNASYLHTSDWLEYNFGSKKWGTIISHLGFSNHFNHHNLRDDGNYIEYGKTYMNILQSLKKGGCFHYTPDLPFIEKYLDNSHFILTKHPISGYDFKATVIKKIK